MEPEVIPITMKAETISQVDKIKEAIHSPNRSDTVRVAIDVMNTISKADGEIRMNW